MDTYTPWETDAVPIFNNLTAVPRYLAGIEDAVIGLLARTLL